MCKRTLKFRTLEKFRFQKGDHILITKGETTQLPAVVSWMLKGIKLRLALLSSLLSVSLTNTCVMFTFHSLA